MFQGSLFTPVMIVITRDRELPCKAAPWYKWARVMLGWVAGGGTVVVDGARRDGAVSVRQQEEGEEHGWRVVKDWHYLITVL